MKTLESPDAIVVMLLPSLLGDTERLAVPGGFIYRTRMWWSNYKGQVSIDTVFVPDDSRCREADAVLREVDGPDVSQTDGYALMDIIRRAIGKLEGNN